MAISPDGSSVLAASRGDSAIASFARNGAGALSYAGCLSGSAATAAQGGNPAACAQLPGATATGVDSGLGSALSLAVSPDSRHVYAVALADDAVAGFALDPATRGLSFLNCISGSSSVAPCAKLAGASPGGVGSALHDPADIQVSPDGADILAVARQASLWSARSRRRRQRRLRRLPQRGRGDPRLHADPRRERQRLRDRPRSGERPRPKPRRRRGVRGLTGRCRDHALRAGGRPPLGPEPEPEPEPEPAPGPKADPVKLKLSGKRKQRNPKLIKVTARCNVDCRVVVRPKGQRVQTRTARANLAAGRRKTLKLRFQGARTKRRVQQALRRRRPGPKLKVTLLGKATAADGSADRDRFKLIVGR